MVLEELNITTVQLFGMGYVISMFVFTLIFNSLILWFLTKKLGFKKTRYEYALLITFITAFISLVVEFFIPIGIEMWMFPLYFAIDVILIYLIYPESLKKSLQAAFIWWILAAVVSLVLGIIIGLILSAIGITIGVQPLLMWLTG
ncbi:MAG: hypothetical protein KAU24_00355 [Candidatus Aenigmarchaeota archaeon]|nr:hypothetical protein [Candidatus Aenigmarchaeota archaeon]